MTEQRTHLRVAVHYRLTVHHAGVEGHGTTENLSDNGAMLSLDVDPPVAAGDPIRIDLELPGHGVVRLAAMVRWASTVLPGMTGVEFVPPVVPELLAHLAQLDDNYGDAASPDRV